MKLSRRKHLKRLKPPNSSQIKNTDLSRTLSPVRIWGVLLFWRLLPVGGGDLVFRICPCMGGCPPILGGGVTSFSRCSWVIPRRLRAGRRRGASSRHAYNHQRRCGPASIAKKKNSPLIFFFYQRKPWGTAAANSNRKTAAGNFDEIATAIH